MDHGVNLDYHMIIDLYWIAGTEGLSKLQLRLRIMYEDREGVTQDYHQATGRYQRSTDQGNAWHNIIWTHIQ